MLVFGLAETSSGTPGGGLTPGTYPNATVTVGGDGNISDVETGSASAGDMLSEFLYAEVDVSANTTLTGDSFGIMYNCVTGDPDANYQITLPDPTGNDGKLLGIRIAQGNAGLVQIDGDGADIDGEPTRLLWENEVAILKAQGGAWTKIAGKSRPMMGFLYRTDAQSIGPGGWVTIQVDQISVAEPAAFVNVAEHRIDILRPGRYIAEAFATLTSVSGSFLCVVSPAKGSFPAEDPNAFNYNAAGVYVTAGGTGTAPAKCSAGESWYCVMFQNGLASFDTGGASSERPCLSVVEVPEW